MNDNDMNDNICQSVLLYFFRFFSNNNTSKFRGTDEDNLLS